MSSTTGRGSTGSRWGSSCTRHGGGAASALAALDFGFEQHGLQRIISVTAAAHAAARRVMEKAGLRYGGTRYWMNPDVPVVWYAIDRAAWRASKSEGRPR